MEKRKDAEEVKRDEPGEKNIIRIIIYPYPRSTFR